jgi:hypothetical protein
VRGGCVLVSVPTVPLRRLGVLLGRFRLVRLVVGHLQVMMEGRRAVGSGLAMVLRSGVLVTRHHGSMPLSSRRQCRLTTADEPHQGDQDAGAEEGDHDAAPEPGRTVDEEAHE